MDLDLSGIFKLVLYLLNNIASHYDHLIIRDNVGLDHNTYLTACLDCEGLFNTVVTGPGRIVIQTMPMAKTAGVIAQYIPNQSN